MGSRGSSAPAPTRSESAEAFPILARPAATCGTRTSANSFSHLFPSHVRGRQMASFLRHQFFCPGWLRWRPVLIGAANLFQIQPKCWSRSKAGVGWSVTTILSPDFFVFVFSEPISQDNINCVGVRWERSGGETPAGDAESMQPIYGSGKASFGFGEPIKTGITLHGELRKQIIASFRRFIKVNICTRFTCPWIIDFYYAAVI